VQKGKIERLNRTIDDTLLRSLPGWADGPRAASGQLLGVAPSTARNPTLIVCRR
jgi:hypothetical protein